MSDPVEPEPRRVALLRGINLGGRRTIPMARLRELAVGLGWRRVATHLQSGNLLFEAAGSDAQVSSALVAAVDAEFGISVEVILRDARRLADLVAEFPFEVADPARAVIAFFDIEVGELAVRRLQELALGTEQVALAASGRDAFLSFPGGQAGSRLAAGMLAAVRPVGGTARNLRTVSKLVELLG